MKRELYFTMKITDYKCVVCSFVVIGFDSWRYFVGYGLTVISAFVPGIFHMARNE